MHIYSLKIHNIPVEDKLSNMINKIESNNYDWYISYNKFSGNYACSIEKKNNYLNMTKRTESHISPEIAVRLMS